MNLFWAVIITALSVVAGSSLCFWLLHKAREVDSSAWILEHIICPIFRVIVLMIIVSVVYPAIAENTSMLDFWRVLNRQGQFSDLLNILFFGSLLLGLVPIVNHPVFALPLQSCLALALVFHWHFADQLTPVSLLPPLTLALEIGGYMLLVYMITRESSIQLSRWIERKLVISGSIHLVSDAIYLVLQIPVMLMYCSFLSQLLLDKNAGLQ